MYGDKDPGHASTLTRRYSHMHARAHTCQLQTGNGSYKAPLPLGAPAHLAVFESVSLLSSCAGAIDSLSRVMWQHLWISWPWWKKKKEKEKRKKRLTTAAKPRWQKQSPCPSMDYIRSSRDVNHALISSVLQRWVLCGKIAAACGALVRLRTFMRRFI